MRVKVPLAVVVAFVVPSCAMAQSGPHRPTPAGQPRQKDLPTTPSVELVAPLSPEQMPASPPQVAFSNDTLTIDANNATLGDILRAVHRQTGAAIDVPGNATDRVVGKFGPGPVRDVMTSLLNGSHFNYVLVGSATNPNGLERVVLISRSTGIDQVAPSPPASQYRSPVGVPQSAEVSNDDGAEMPETNEAADDQANQPQPAEDQQQQAPQQNPFGQGGAVKTPEQLLQELQQRQQQMQQQQQGSPQSFPQAPVQLPQPQQQPQEQ
ncbi:MAG TPA: hypothetical protein VEI26_17040 [Terriglobales bacterium]|nr:hypothetical protein [Terriglobales bacterium]